MNLTLKCCASLLFIVPVVLAPKLATAGCVYETTEIIETHPSDGAVDVPTNASFFVVSNPYTYSIEFNGEMLGWQGGAWHLSLQPNQTYTVTVAAQTIEFTTGAGDAAIPDAPEIESAFLTANPTVTADLPEFDGVECLELPFASECFDTGDPYLARFDLRDEAAGWIITSSDGLANMWPSSCAKSAVWAGYRPTECFTIQAVSEHGVVSAGTEHCFETPDADMGNGDPAGQDAGTDDGTTAQPDSGTTDGDDSSSGCSQVSGESSWLVLLIGLFGPLGLRRRL